ncbi:hypothetical protein DFH29DRAFT_1072826 [Suillus ampliporus]|nr:hypothetical protein DFH29DRAFT_1072826 [Suillus ampliporus]
MDSFIQSFFLFLSVAKIYYTMEAGCLLYGVGVQHRRKQVKKDFGDRILWYLLAEIFTHGAHSLLSHRGYYITTANADRNIQAIPIIAHTEVGKVSSAIDRLREKEGEG